MVIGDPSYFPDKVEKCGQVVRAICIMDHPVPDTGNANSVQIICPASQLGRKTGYNINDLFNEIHVIQKKYTLFISTLLYPFEKAPLNQSFLGVYGGMPNFDNDFHKAKCLEHLY